MLGDIILPNTETGTDNAAWLNQQCIERGPEMLGRQNGYYLAGMIDQHDVVYLAADQLGLMPLYYWAGTDHFCFSTSPNAFISHPHFNTTPDLMGVAGILLTMHATGNRTTWQDVRRLPPGHLLRWRKGEGITLSDVNSLKAHDSHFGWPPSRCQDLIQNSFNEAVQRLDKLGETAVLLSGGLDSRLGAGCLRWMPASPPLPRRSQTTNACAAGLRRAGAGPIIRFHKPDAYSGGRSQGGSKQADHFVGRHGCRQRFREQLNPASCRRGRCDHGWEPERL